jgi:hypothetical protein
VLYVPAGGNAGYRAGEHGTVGALQPFLVNLTVGIRIYPHTALANKAWDDGVITAEDNLIMAAFLPVGGDGRLDLGFSQGSDFSTSHGFFEAPGVSIRDYQDFDKFGLR